MDKNDNTTLDTNKVSRDTDEERENTEEIEDKKRARKKEEKAPIKTAVSKPSKAAEIATDICFLLLILLTYIIMMAISGGSVYAAYGWRGRGSNGTFFNSVSGMVGVAVENLSPTTPSSRQMNPTSRAISCPTAPTCPPPGGCVPREDSCIPQLPPPCIPQPTPARETCLDQLPCQSGSCCPPRCPTPTPEPSIAYFRSARLDSKTGFEWLNMFPPYSPQRLEVVTHLMDTFIEPWAVAGFFHRCTDGPPGSGLDRDTTVCSFCNKRYDYIKCIMSNTLVGPLYPTGETSFYNINTENFKSLAHTFANAIYDKGTPTTALDSVFEHIERAINPFAVRTENGQKCEVCTDFSRFIFNNCISDPNKKHYVHPKDRGQH